MSKSSSKIGPLNESAVGIVYLRKIERDYQAVANMALPFGVFQLLHAVGVISVGEKFEVQ